MEIHFAATASRQARLGLFLFYFYCISTLFPPYFHIISILFPFYFFQSTTFEMVRPFKKYA
jgi:hypothetical protein